MPLRVSEGKEQKMVPGRSPLRGGGARSGAEQGRGRGPRTSSGARGTLQVTSPWWKKLGTNNKSSETWKRDVGPDFAGGHGIWS